MLEISEAELLRPLGRASFFRTRCPTLEATAAHAEVRYVRRQRIPQDLSRHGLRAHVPARGELGYVYTFDDLTEIRRLEREVRMQDRLAAVGRLAAAIAHEIRNPLTSIAGSVSMLSGCPELESRGNANCCRS